MEKYESDEKNPVIYYHPWSAEDFPLAVRWLNANEKSLAKLLAAAEKPKFFLPMVCPESPPNLPGVMLPNHSCSLPSARAFGARAMLRLQTGQVEEASRDLLTLHRLARLVSDEPPTMINRLVGMCMEAVALTGDIKLAQWEKSSPRIVREHLKQLQALPPLADIISVFEETECFVYLDTIQMISRGKWTVKNIQGEGFREEKQTEKDLQDHKRFLKIQEDVDWKFVYAETNRYCDEFVKALKGESYDEKLLESIQESYFDLSLMEFEKLHQLHKPKSNPKAMEKFSPTLLIWPTGRPIHFLQNK